MDEQMTKARVLLLDIETKPILAYVWRLWDQNISLPQIVAPGGTICVGAKWMGDKDMIFYSEWEDGQQGMIEGMHSLISEADAIVTYNGDKFDLPKLTGEFVRAGLRPPPPPTSIDVYKTVRQLGFDSGKLDFVGPLLDLGKKIKHEGFSLWTKTMDGDEKAQGRMKKYCLQDVKLLEKVYLKLRPYVKNHPNMSFDEERAEKCGACGSKRTQKRGFRHTKHFSIQRIQCQDCGSWGEGTRKKISGVKKDG
jgi:hypothetical protein